jgi:ABC-type antimicrobial peptide transport system permease subunit
MRQGLVLGIVGLAAGLALALAVARLLAGQLVGISPVDPVSFVGTATLLLAIAAVASALPARRAARLDPLVALRRE